MGESEERDMEKVAARYEDEADDLQHRGEEVDNDIDDTRQEWQRKRGDASVPGAVPDESGEDSKPADEDAKPAEEDADA